MVRVMRLSGELLSPEALDGLDLFFVEVVDPLLHGKHRL